ncbi:MAG: hypothetical protein LBC96_05425 [Lachnospiraceae bacterium]|jgi:hypothetical protein|nr:hypothetical protein [Lachnospiraceae bacterium]
MNKNADKITFPRTSVAGVSLPRMLIGTNWILGWSHRSTAADGMIELRNRNKEAIADIVEVFLSHDVNAMMAPVSQHPVVAEGAKLAEDRTGKQVILIDTPIINVDDTAEARREAEATIKACRDIGATFCLPHHSSVEELVNKNKRIIDRLPDYLSMIREQGMIPGLSAHMPELIVYSDEQGYDVETYIQIYNCLGYMMQVEIEYIHKVIWNAKKPVMTIKSMAAGRVTPLVGITFSYATIRPCDMVTVGCFTPDEAREDIEIGLAAIERRKPDLEGRSSPNKTAAMSE